MGRRYNNGGVGGSGVFGLVGTTIQCPSNDTSLYCTIIKIFNLIIIGLFFYFLYMIFVKKT